MLLIWFQEKLSMNLYASTGSTITLMGAVDISLAEVLMFPQNKIQLTTKLMSVSSECDHEGSYCGCNVTVAKTRHLGNLTMWFRLTCELDVLKSLYTDFDQWRSPTKNPDQKTNTESTSKKEPETSKIPNLNIKSTANRIENLPTDDETLISITIQCVKLNESFELPTDSTEQIHVECNFLCSRRLKTEPKPLSTNELIYNFTHKYIHTEHNLQRLMSALNDPEHSIKFVLVKGKAMQNLSKSLTETNAMSEDESRMENVEFGFGLLHLGKFIYELSDNFTNVRYTIPISILSRKPPYQNIGCLEISIENISKLKQLQKQHQISAEKIIVK